ncbi:MAG TPA: ATP-binding cassette domain-containing protein [Alphaproteobacteria bacterium]|jgi:branched-chain amino acid transport system ATP-binding protein|nr:ATP-binding cassette domain-containing protein [Alphaproteobacteria bacterium]
MTGTSLLAVDGLTMRFGGLQAVDRVSFEVACGEIAALIGPNGAGKTTVFNCVTGFYRPTAGQIELTRDGRALAIERLAGHLIARAGIARTFQNIRLFPHMTALENLLIARHNALTGTSVIAGIAHAVSGLFGLPLTRRAEADATEIARLWLARVGLVDDADRPAGTLPYGAQRRLEIARAMCTEPVLLCVDEPAAGLNAGETRELAQLLRNIRDHYGASVLLIEHHMAMVMDLSDHVVVLDHGHVIADGSAEAVRHDPKVIRAYLGEEEGVALPQGSGLHGESA